MTKRDLASLIIKVNLVVASLGFVGFLLFNCFRIAYMYYGWLGVGGTAFCVVNFCAVMWAVNTTCYPPLK